MGLDTADVELEQQSTTELYRNAVTAHALALAGIPEPLIPQFAEATDQIVQYESAWDPDAAMKAAADGQRLRLLGDGHPEDAERSLMQLSPRDFADFHVTGTSNNIYDPVASIAAGWRYLSHWYAVNLQTGHGLTEFIDRLRQNPGKRYGQPDRALIRH